MDKRLVASLDKQIAVIDARRKKLEDAKDVRYAAWRKKDDELSKQRDVLIKKRLDEVVPFKVGQIVQSYDPLGLFEIVEIQKRCYARDPDDYVLRGIRLTQSGHWGFCPTKKQLYPSKCKLWIRPDKETAKKVKVAS